MSKLRAKFSDSDVEVLARETCHRGWLQVDRLRLRHKLYEGGWSQPMDREVLLKDHAVGVLLYDPVRDCLVLVRQFRVGVLAEQQSPWLLELVAGLIDTDESAEQVARRESVEEANLEPIELLRICDYYNSPGGSNENVTLYCGRIDSSAAGGIFGLKDEHEDIEVVVLSFDEAITGLEAGEINNAMSIIALQWLQLNKAELQQRWT